MAQTNVPFIYLSFIEWTGFRQDSWASSRWGLVPPLLFGPFFPSWTVVFNCFSGKSTCSHLLTERKTKVSEFFTQGQRHFSKVNKGHFVSNAAVAAHTECCICTVLCRTKLWTQGCIARWRPMRFFSLQSVYLTTFICCPRQSFAKLIPDFVIWWNVETASSCNYFKNENINNNTWYVRFLFLWESSMLNPTCLIFHCLYCFEPQMDALNFSPLGEFKLGIRRQLSEMRWRSLEESFANMRAYRFESLQMSTLDAWRTSEYDRYWNATCFEEEVGSRSARTLEDRRLESSIRHVQQVLVLKLCLVVYSHADPTPFLSLL